MEDFGAIDLNAFEDRHSPDQSEEESNVVDKQVYQSCKGQNVFLLGERLIIARNSFFQLGSVTIGIIGPVIMFCVVVERSFLYILSHHVGISVIVLTVGFMVYVLAMLVMTSGRDPGILPRKPLPPFLMEQWQEVMINGEQTKLKYCSTCHVYRPPRCSHCSKCDNCVQRFDHHCPYVAQCIGRRNYRYYFLFISSVTVLSVFIWSLCLFYILKIRAIYNITIWQSIIKSPATIIATILIIYSTLPIVFVAPLTIFHMYLICTNQTTHEFYKRKYNHKPFKIYNQGVINNIKEILFSRIPRSEINFWAKVSSVNCDEVVDGDYYQVVNDQRMPAAVIEGEEILKESNVERRVFVNLCKIHSSNRDTLSRGWWRSHRSI